MMVHVLIVDDNEVGVKVLAQLVQYTGASYEAIQDPALLPQEAEAFRRFDVIFLDLEMPKADGFEVLRTLKGNLGVDMPIIAYTVHTSEIHKAMEEGFDGFLGKPLIKELFPQQLERILKREPVWELP